MGRSSVFVWTFVMTILCSTYLCEVNSQNSTTETDDPESFLDANEWKKMELVLKNLVNAGIRTALPRIMEVMETSRGVNISSNCTANMIQLISGIRKLKTWAFKLLDANGKVLDGLLSGTLGSLGDFDQCLDTEAPNERRGRSYGKVIFRGKYCAVNIRPQLPPKKHFYKIDSVWDEFQNITKKGTIMEEMMRSINFFHFLTIRLGICVPSGCSAQDIQGIIQTVRTGVKWVVTVDRCEVKEENEVTPIMIGVLILYSSFGFLMILGTLVHLFHRYSKRKISHFGLRAICCFSLISNFQKLFNTKNVLSNMSCLNGMRFLSISWIVMAHTYLNVNFQILGGLRRAAEFPKNFAFQAVVNATVSVDTFFFMSGLLVCYTGIKMIRDEKIPFNIGFYLLHRFLRLTPVYIFVIAMAFLGPLLGSGPIWHETVDKFIDSCRNNWWTNILFVNNFVNSDEMCLPQSWYIACDMQLYIYALIILLPMLRWPKIGFLISFLTILASMITTAAITYFNKFPPTMLAVHPDEGQRIMYWSTLYFKPYSHAGPYYMGMMIGYLWATKTSLHIPLSVRIIGWITAIISNMSVLYGVYSWNNDQDPTFWETLFYSGCHRVGWAVGLAWIAVSCFYGYGGVVNYILSWKAWIPLSRLSYAIYLIHPVVQMAFIGNIRSNVQATHYFAVWIYFGHLMVTVGISFIGSMLVEAPIFSLERLCLTKRFQHVPATAKENHFPQSGENNVDYHVHTANGKKAPALEEKKIIDRDEIYLQSKITDYEIVSKL